MTVEQAGLPDNSDPYASVKSAFSILAKGAPDVAQSLLDIATKGKSEMARMYAAQAVLDRIGLPAKVDVGVTSVTFSGGSVGPDPDLAVNTIAKRLAALREQRELTIKGNVIEFPGVMVQDQSQDSPQDV